MEKFKILRNGYEYAVFTLVQSTGTSFSFWQQISKNYKRPVYCRRYALKNDITLLN